MSHGSSSIIRARIRLLAKLAGLLCIACLAGCGSSGADQPAVRVGHHTITSGEVKRWLSVLIARGYGLTPGPVAPVPPAYTGCIAYYRANRPSGIPGQQTPTTGQLKSFCGLQYRRYKLKAIYLLVTYQWVTGEAAELGVHLNRAELAQDLAGLKKLLGINSAAAWARFLRASRSRPADTMVGFELEQLVRAIEAKVGGTKGSEEPTPQGRQALAQFGATFERRWKARTDCEPGYVVPVCRQYKPPKTPPELIPPGIPLTNRP